MSKMGEWALEHEDDFDMAAWDQYEQELRQQEEYLCRQKSRSGLIQPLRLTLHSSPLTSFSKYGETIEITYSAALPLKKSCDD